MQCGSDFVVPETKQLDFLIKNEIEDDSYEQIHQSMFPKISSKDWKKFSQFFIIQKHQQVKFINSTVHDAFKLWNFETTFPMKKQ